MKKPVLLSLFTVLCLIAALTACAGNESTGGDTTAPTIPVEEPTAPVNEPTVPVEEPTIPTKKLTIPVNALSYTSQDAEIVDLGCCVKDVEVRESARIGANSVTHINNDFIMTLNSNKHTYSTDDTIKIWGTLEYVGDNNTVRIWHSCPFMAFTIAGGKFGLGMGGFSFLILTSSVLESRRVYHFEYQKNGVWNDDDPNAKYWEDFVSEEDLFLPAGEYTITLSGDFGLSERVSENESGLKAELGIVVTQ